MEKQNKMKEKQNREKIIAENFDLSRFFELTSSDKSYVTGLNLHEIKSEMLKKYTGDFELGGLMVIAPIERKTNVRFKNKDETQWILFAVAKLLLLLGMFIN